MGMFVSQSAEARDGVNMAAIIVNTFINLLLFNEFNNTKILVFMEFLIKENYVFSILI
jgi:hypothetical protein